VAVVSTFGRKPINPGEVVESSAPVVAVAPDVSLSEEGLSQNQLEMIERVKRYIPSVIKAFLRAFHRKSMAAAVKAKCIDCSCYQKVKVAECQISGCSLWRYRPYQGKKSKVELEAEPVGVEEVEEVEEVDEESPAEVEEVDEGKADADERDAKADIQEVG